MWLMCNNHCFFPGQNEVSWNFGKIAFLKYSRCFCIHEVVSELIHTFHIKSKVLINKHSKFTTARLKFPLELPGQIHHKTSLIISTSNQNLIRLLHSESRYMTSQWFTKISWSHPQFLLHGCSNPTQHFHNWPSHFTSEFSVFSLILPIRLDLSPHVFLTPGV